MNNFADILKDLRQENELSILALSRKTGISHSTICRWENGQSDIKSDELVKLAQFFGVTTDFLLGLEY